MTARQLGTVGLAVALLFGAGNALWYFDQPDPGATAAEALEFYEGGSGRIVAGASLSLIAIALFIVFASGLRSLLAAADGDQVLANAAFGGALVAMATGLGAETANAAAANLAADGELSGELAQTLFELSYALGFPAAGVGVAVVLLATAAVSLRSGRPLPRWLAVVAVAIAVALLTPAVEYALAAAVALLGSTAAALALRQPSIGNSSSWPSS